MRLSLWQQFSSNHSADYVIVGVFASVEAAQMAASKIQQSVVEIATWYEQNKPRSVHLSPIEENLEQQYNFDWKEAIDWLAPFRKVFIFPYQREPQEHIITYDRLVFVDAPGSETWQTGHQFANLIASLGGKPFSHVYMGENPNQVSKYISFDLECLAPTNELAIEIQNIIESHVRSVQNYQISSAIPWSRHHSRYATLISNMPLDKYLNAEQVWIKNHQAWAEFLNSHPTTEAERREKWRSFITQDEQLDRVIGYLRNETGLYKAACTRHDNALEIKEVSAHSLEGALPALLTWLQTLGCRIDYHFHQIEET